MASRRKDSWTTAAELMAELQQDPEYLARKKQRDAELQARVREWRNAAAPVVADLRAAGVDVDSEWDLVNARQTYPNAVHVLLEHLPRPYPDRVREGIARALAAQGPDLLAARRNRRAWDVLSSEFRNSDDPTTLGAKWGIACALSVAGDDSVMEEAIELLGERRHGENRIPLLDILARSRAPEAQELLGRLAGDPQLCGGVEELRKKKRRRQ